MEDYSVDTKALRMAMTAAEFDTYVSLAKTMGVSERTVSSVIKSGKKPSYNVMRKMADALSLTGNEAAQIFFSPNLRGT